MIKLSHIATALLLASISVAHAETANQPVSQGAASVNKNLTRDPDNKGLQNAAERLQENEAKVAAKRAAAEQKSDEAKHKKNREEKHERTMNRDKMERPAKPERPGR